MKMHLLNSVKPALREDSNHTGQGPERVVSPICTTSAGADQRAALALASVLRVSAVSLVAVPVALPGNLARMPRKTRIR
jgi:hypothetical protein